MTKRLHWTSYVAVVLAVVATPVFGQQAGPNEKRGVPGTERSTDQPGGSKSGSKSSLTPTTSTGNVDVFTNITIPAGQTIALDSSLDYSGSVTVGITVLCSLCTSNATSLASGGLGMQALWAAMDKSPFVATESKAGSSLAYWDAGGVLFNVFGPIFRLNLQNRGSQGLLIQQITVFRRAL